MSLFWIYRGIVISHQQSINTNSGLKQFKISHYEFSKAGTSNEIFKRLVDWSWADSVVGIFILPGNSSA